MLLECYRPLFVYRAVAYHAGGVWLVFGEEAARHATGGSQQLLGSRAACRIQVKHGAQERGEVLVFARRDSHGLPTQHTTGVDLLGAGHQLQQGRSHAEDISFRGQLAFLVHFWSGEG